MSIATSGNYLNYNNIDNVKVGHIFDARQNTAYEGSITVFPLLQNLVRLQMLLQQAYLRWGLMMQKRGYPLIVIFQL